MAAPTLMVLACAKPNPVAKKTADKTTVKILLFIFSFLPFDIYYLVKPPSSWQKKTVGLNLPTAHFLYSLGHDTVRQTLILLKLKK